MRQLFWSKTTRVELSHGIASQAGAGPAVAAAGQAGSSSIVEACHCDGLQSSHYKNLKVESYLLVKNITQFLKNILKKTLYCEKIFRGVRTQLPSYSKKWPTKVKTCLSLEP